MADYIRPTLAAYNRLSWRRLGTKSSCRRSYDGKSVRFDALKLGCVPQSAVDFQGSV
jgi:hypothetical protein